LSSPVTFITFCNCNEYSLGLNSGDGQVNASDKRNDQTINDTTKTQEGSYRIFYIHVSMDFLIIKGCDFAANKYKIWQPTAALAVNDYLHHHFCQTDLI